MSIKYVFMFIYIDDNFKIINRNELVLKYSVFIEKLEQPLKQNSQYCHYKK